MNNEKFEQLLNKLYSSHYFNAKELQYGNKANTFLSPFEYKEFVKYKEEQAINNNRLLTLIPLKTFNHKCLYFCFGEDLKASVEIYLNLSNINPSISYKYNASFIDSKIYSEIEGSLNVENIPTTRRRLKELLEEDAPINSRNDLIIKNMKAGIDFINELPEFNKENLFKLYSILSNGCLNEEDCLKDGDIYRYDSVEIAHYQGCPHNLIEECMNSLFSYVNKLLINKKDNLILLPLLPYIAHYYILYIHPYFDYNGRTARMVSYWINLLTNEEFPPIISEAINQTKKQYYIAIEESRDSHNDITYFLKYIFDIANDYLVTYLNLDVIKTNGKKDGYSITTTELNYIKKILISYDGPFSYLDFLKMANIEISKQGAFKILNKFLDIGILKSVITKSKTKLFDVNSEYIPYRLRNFGYRSK